MGDLELGPKMLSGVQLLLRNIWDIMADLSPSSLRPEQREGGKAPLCQVSHSFSPFRTHVIELLLSVSLLVSVSRDTKRGWQ